MQPLADGFRQQSFETIKCSLVEWKVNQNLNDMSYVMPRKINTSKYICIYSRTLNLRMKSLDDDKLS